MDVERTDSGRIDRWKGGGWPRIWWRGDDSTTMNAEHDFPGSTSGSGSSRSSSSQKIWFPVTVTVVALVHHILLTVLVNYIPNDGFSAGMTAYALFGTAVSVLGFFGVVSDRPQPVSIFATYLMVDALIAVFCRLAIMWLLANTTFEDIRQMCRDAASYGFESSAGLQSDLRRDVVMAKGGNEHGSLSMQSSRGFGKCWWALNVLQLIMVGLVLALAMLQVTLAAGMRRYKHGIEKRRYDRYRTGIMSMPEKANLGLA